MEQAGRGLLNGLDHAGVAVPQRIDGDARHPISIALALGVIDIGPFTPRQHKVSALVGLGNMRCAQVEQGGCTCCGHGMLLVFQVTGFKFQVWAVSEQLTAVSFWATGCQLPAGNEIK